MKQVNINEVSNHAVRLFKAIPREMVMKSGHSANSVNWSQCFEHGFLVINNRGDIMSDISDEAFRIINGVFGKDAVQFNNTFYQDFRTVRDMTNLERVLDQLMHYMSTYGREMVGLDARPYIPVRDFDFEGIPGMNISVDQILVIQMVEDKVLGDMVDNMVKTVKAPNTMMKNGFKCLWPYMSVSDRDIQSFELKCIYYDETGRVPSQNIDFLRYMVYKTTGRPMLIKDRTTIDIIKRTRIDYKLIGMWQQCDVNSMAEIFYRYKPLFLAFKHIGTVGGWNGRECTPANPNMAHVINRIRRAAVEHHKPLSEASVQNMIQMYLQGKSVAHLVAKASNRDLVKIINSLLNSLEAEQPRVFNIRNGKAFVAEGVAKAPKEYRKRTKMMTYIYDQLIARMGDKYKNVVFVLPEHIRYAVPTSEKQMVYTYPWGTQIKVPGEGGYTMGMHWFDQHNQRVDLDLHMNGLNGAHVGWNGGYYNQEATYSGDMTAAPQPNGAAEAVEFHTRNNDYNMTINKYSGPKDVDFKMFVSKQHVTSDRGKFVYRPADDLIPVIPMQFSAEEDGWNNTMNIGIVHKGDFYFYGGRISSGIVPAQNYNQFIQGVSAKITSMLLMKEFLEDCGATVMTQAPDSAVNQEGEEMAVIDLSPEALIPTTLFEVIDGTVADKALAEIAKKKEEEEKLALDAVQKHLDARLKRHKDRNRNH